MGEIILVGLAYLLGIVSAVVGAGFVLFSQDNETGQSLMIFAIVCFTFMNLFKE